MNLLHYLKYFLFHGIGLISATAILAGGHYMSGGLLLVLLIYIFGDAVCGNDTSTPEFKHPGILTAQLWICLLYTSPSPRDRTRSRMPSSA